MSENTSETTPTERTEISVETSAPKEESSNAGEINDANEVNVEVQKAHEEASDN